VTFPVPQSEGEFPERVAALKARFPYQFRDLFELEINRGWLPIIESLCVDLDALLSPVQKAGISYVQIKEKLGGLRVYWHYAASDASPLPEATSYAIQARIETADAFAQTACETCGAPGELRDSHGWRTVRCDRHTKTQR